jgi:hypothetical protein
MKAKTPEGIILTATKDFLRMKGYYVIRHHQSLGNHPGISDLSAIKDGKTIYIETKSPKWRGQLSKEQAKFQAEIESHGGIFLVIDSVDELFNTVNHL